MKQVKLPDGESTDIVQENIQHLKKLFPDAFTENGLNFHTLRQLLGDLKVLDQGEERYGLNWQGKKQVRQIALTPSLGTLLPCPEESVDWDTTQNLFIEGENLEVLKLLQKSYANKIKVIYIDPPYNTGKEFVYRDKFQDNLDNYLKYTGQIDDEGLKFTSNTETNGRKHTNWLNMMYPRLKLARSLLRENGVLFISIDDNEQPNLRYICDEIFGEENFLSQIIIQSNKRGQTYKEIAKCHEYLLVYYKTDNSSLGEIEKEDNSLPFSDQFGPYELRELRNRNPKFGKHNRPNLYYPIYIDPNSKNEYGLYGISLKKSESFSIEVFPKNSAGEDSCWRWGKEKVQKDGINANPKVLYGKAKQDGGWNICEKSRKSTTKVKSIWTDTKVISEQGTVESGRLEMGGLLEFPKPLELVKRCIQLATSEDELVLDFFAGSSTSAHAVMQLNTEDKAKRKFIMVQLPEPCDEKTNACKAGYKTIAEISKERIRRAAKKIKDENPDYDGDLGFKVFKLDNSNLRAWNPYDSDLEKTLHDNIERIVEGRSDQDILYELLLKRGLELTVPIEQRKIADKTVYSIDNGNLIACLAKTLTENEVEELGLGITAWYKELDLEADTHIFFIDSAFADDIAKTNLTAILEQNGIAHVRSL